MNVSEMLHAADIPILIGVLSTCCFQFHVFSLFAAFFGICSLKIFCSLVCLLLSLLIHDYLASDFECRKFILYDHKLMMVCA